MISGDPQVLGATPMHGGVNFALYSSVAERVELCLYAADGSLQRNVDLPECERDVWHGFLPGLGEGQLYGYRVHGNASASAHYCNPSKLLLDPYAKQIHGDLNWNDAVFGDNSLDSAPYVPKSVVCPEVGAAERRPPVPLADSLIYEANVRGLTKNHPAIPSQDRGRFDGLRGAAILEHLKALGVTAIELLPIHAFVDEHHLSRKGLRNFWGYNTCGFFAPMSRYARLDPVAECRAMVQAFHDAGIEVILDVVYNHTAEGDHRGPCLSFRGIDNGAYYRMMPDGVHYINDTGCGNTLNADQPVVQRMITDSLCYWVRDMGVDGFRFDLAPVLGRHATGFSPEHPLLTSLPNHPQLKDTKLIAEPWDTGPGGYQLGQFPAPWAEWNDRYRDRVRGFWRGDAAHSGALAQALRGSAELFDRNQRAPSASINFITSHDGFTLRDTASYLHKHNEANGENNRDGHAHNLSVNFGVEGQSDDPAVRRARRQYRLNMLGTLILSQGTPMILAGDELGNSQQGNNNAYAQDNPTGWVDWSGLEEDPAFTHAVQLLTRFRHQQSLLRIDRFLHEATSMDNATVQVYWLNANGQVRFGDDWHSDPAFSMVLHQSNAQEIEHVIAVAFNMADSARRFILDSLPDTLAWRLQFASAETGCVAQGAEVEVPASSLAVMITEPRASTPAG